VFGPMSGKSKRAVQSRRRADQLVQKKAVAGNSFVPELAFGDLKRSTPGCFNNRPETEIKISMHDTFERVFCARGIFSYTAW
jgi:hypothetical protein